jgi:hypothetical protein
VELTNYASRQLSVLYTPILSLGRPHKPDLLSRYLTLFRVTSTCAQHAQGTKLNVQDAISTLDELSVNLEELRDYCATEGRESNRYALISLRRVEDLHEFKCMYILEMPVHSSHFL